MILKRSELYTPIIMLGYDKKDFELLDFDAPESAPQNLFEE